MMSADSTPERTVPLAEAERLVRAALDGLSLRPELREWRGAGEPTAWTCTLHDDLGQVAPHAEGSGKGDRAEARVGALFEALESARPATGSP